MKIIEFVQILSPTTTKEALLLGFCPQDFNCKGDCEHKSNTMEQCLEC